jgi:hypothetical protein
MTVAHLDTERFIDQLRAYLDAPEGGEVNSDTLEATRQIIADLVGLRFARDNKAESVIAEVYDSNRERLRIIRTPHPHKIRDPHGVDGASLAEAMESIELLVLTTSDAVRGIAAEISHQETAREARARHIAMCEPVRRWGESLLHDQPRLARILIGFATEARAPTMLTEDESCCLGFGHTLATQLLDPTRIDDLTAYLIEMARAKLE